jgi:hypothetical protein
MTTHRDYTDQEIERRGEAIYAERIHPTVGPEDNGKFVTIDIETGAWDMGVDVLALAARLHENHPEAALYTLRVGFPYTARIGMIDR